MIDRVIILFVGSDIGQARKKSSRTRVVASPNISQGLDEDSECLSRKTKDRSVILKSREELDISSKELLSNLPSELTITRCLRDCCSDFYVPVRIPQGEHSIGTRTDQ